MEEAAADAAAMGAAAGVAAASAAAGPGACSPQRPQRMLGLLRVQSLSADEAFDDYLAWVVDKSCLAVLFVGFVLATVLIFALQSGYVELS